MTRRYCGKCKHFVYGFSDKYYEHCNKAGIVQYDNYRGSYTRAETPMEKNRDKRCKDWRQAS